MSQKLLHVLLFSAFLFSCQKTSTNAKPVILFVCEHGAARSPIAAAYFNKLAEEQNLNYIAIFRGTDPNETLTSGTEEGLRNDGISTTGWRPKGVTDIDMKEAHKIITFDLTLTPLDNNDLTVEQWDGTPPISQDYEIARDIILSRVNQLIGALTKEKIE